MSEAAKRQVSNHDEPTISSSVLLSLYNELAEHRDAMNRGLSHFGIGMAELQDFHGHISLRDFVALFEWLANALNDRWLGLRLALRSGPDALGAVGYLFMSSGTVENAVTSLSRYLDAIQSSSRISISYLGDLVQVRYGIIDDTIAPRRQDSEYSIALTWRYMRLLSKGQCRAVQVSFEHGQNAADAEYPRRAFGAPVLFGAEANELTLTNADFHRWHEGLDPHLFPILEDHINLTLSRRESPSTFAEVVTQRLSEHVLASGARAKLVAEMLGIATVTLHRRLASEGIRFKELVDAQARSVATRLLRYGNLPIATIASRVGFSDPAAFTRAFRRWYDMTPRDYRNELRESRTRTIRESLD